MGGWPFGEYPAGGLERLGPHVTAFYAEDFPLSNSAIVRGTEATLVFDANFAEEGLKLREAVEAEGPPLRDLVLSHYHDDHTLGAMHLAPPALVRSRAHTRERLSAWATDPDLPDLPEGIRVVVPDSLVEEQEVLDLGGGVLVRLIPEPEAHTRGDLWAFVEPDGVALCGDLWFTSCEPYLGSGSVAGAILAIDRLRDAEANIYLPGHGRAATLPPRGHEPVQRLCAWLLEQTSTEMARGLQGDDLAAAVRAAFAQRDDIRFPFAIPGFLEEGVVAAVRDLSGRINP
jgi:glyoxylase-like metal-dependent hydrolase (beta-lactamase superfamily II)